MGAFDHIILLLSFVYALAIAHLLATTAQLIRESERVRFSGLVAFWMVNSLASIMANWISFWDMRGLPSWSVGTILFTFVIAFTNYLAAALACPEVVRGEPLDLVDFARRQRPRYVGAFLAIVVVALAANWVYGSMYGMVTWDLANLAVLPMLALTVAALIWPQRWVQWTVAGLMTVIWVVYFVVVQPPIR
jgi:hypothetical protein